MARAKKKEDKNTLYYAALYSKHSELYEMAYEDSKKVVNSVLDSIKQLLKECEVLSLPDFGKFENHERKSYGRQLPGLRWQEAYCADQAHGTIHRFPEAERSLRPVLRYDAGGGRW